MEEVSQGDQRAAQKRLDKLETFAVLPLTEEVEYYANRYLIEGIVPPTNPGDALHLAFATAYEIEILVTWNFKHLANAFVRRRLRTVNSFLGLSTPTIFTPEELLGE